MKASFSLTIGLLLCALACEVSADTDWQGPVSIELPAPTRSVLLDASVTVESWVGRLRLFEYQATPAGGRQHLVQFQMNEREWADGRGICDEPGVLACETAACVSIQADANQTSAEVSGLDGSQPVKARVVKKAEEVPEASDPESGAGMCNGPLAAAPWEQALDSAGAQGAGGEIHLQLDLAARGARSSRSSQRRAALDHHSELQLQVTDGYEGGAVFSADNLPADTTDYELLVSEGCREVRIPLESIQPAYVPGVVLAAMSSADVASVAATHSLQIINQTELRSTQESLVLFAAENLSTVLAALALDTRVVAAQREYIYTTIAEDYTDPLAPFAYGPRESGALYLHEATQGSEQTIAIIDTGVAVEHPELVGRVETEDFTGEGFTPDQHGTAVAAIIAAAANNQQGAYGVAPQAKLIALKACHPVDGGLKAKCRSSAIVKAVDAAIEKDAQIINMSIAGPPDVMVRRYVGLATQQNRLVVAGAGNGGPNARPAYPAALPDVLAVTAIDARGRLYRDANRGDYIDLAAPGVEILTPTPDGQGYPWTSGTSWAAAHVSGVAALLRDLIPFAGGQELVSVLKGNADDLGRYGTDDDFGDGAVNACKAVSAGTAAAVECAPEGAE